MMIRYFLAATGNSLKRIPPSTLLIIVISFHSHIFLNNLSRKTNIVNSFEEILYCALEETFFLLESCIL